MFQPLSVTGIAAEGLNSDFEEKLDGIVKRESGMPIGNFRLGALLPDRSTKGLFIKEANPRLNEGGVFFLLKGVFFFKQIVNFQQMDYMKILLYQESDSDFSLQSESD